MKKKYLIEVILFIIIFLTSNLLFHVYAFNNLGINGYHRLNYDHKNGVSSNDTTIIYGAEGEFIYSIDNGINWKQSYCGAVSLEIYDSEIFRNEIIFLDNFGLRKGKIGENLWRNFRISGLPFNTYLKQLYNDNNERLICITSDGKLYIIHDINSDKHKEIIISKTNFINPQFIYTGNKYLILDQYSIYWSNDLKEWNKKEFNSLNYTITDYEEIHGFNYLSTYKEILKLDNNFEIITKFETDPKKNNIGFIKENNKLFIVDDNPFVQAKDSIYLNEIKENDTIIPQMFYMFINKVLGFQRYNVKSLLKIKDEYLILGSSKLLISMKKGSYKIKSILARSVLQNASCGQRLKFETKLKGVVISSNYQPFITHDGGATFFKFGDIGSTPIVNPNFETKGDTIIYFLQTNNFGAFLFSEDFGLTYKKYEFEGFIKGSCKLIILNNGYLLCNNIDETVGLFTKIYKFDKNFKPDSIREFDGYKFADGKKYDSITTIDIFSLNDDVFYLFAFDRRYDQNFKIRLYKISENGTNLSVVGDSNINLNYFYKLKDNTFFSIQKDNNVENVYLSNDMGNTWELKYIGESIDSLRSTTFLVEDNRNIYYINYLKLLKSQDYGSSWERFNLNLYSMETNGFSVAEDVKYLSLYGFTANMLLKSIPEDFATSIENTENQIEEMNYLYTMPPYPNPTRSEVTAKFYWDSRIDIDNSEIAVFDLNGNKVSGKENLSLEKLNEWSGNIKWNCTGVPSGTYLIKIQHGNNTKSVKVVVN